MIRDYLSNNLSNEVTVELHVTNEKPSAAGLRMQTVTVAVGGSITIEPPFGNDPEQDPISAGEVLGPFHGTAEWIDGALKYTPDETYLGWDALVYLVDDDLARHVVPDGYYDNPDSDFWSNFSQHGVIRFEMTDTDRPVAEDDVYNMWLAENAVDTLVANVLNNDHDPNGDPLTPIAVSVPSGMSLELDTQGRWTGVFHYTPAASFAGIATLTYKVSDGVLESAEATAVIDVRRSGIDLDIDSDNTGAIENSANEELLEDDSQVDGKYIGVNDGDDDLDGVPGHSDGYNLDGIDGNADDSSSTGFTPLQVRLPAGMDPQRATITFSYAASTPWLTTEPATYYAEHVQYAFALNDPALRRLRLWAADFPARNKQLIDVGGHYVDSGTGYRLADFGYNGEAKVITLYIEAVHPSLAVADERIEVTLNPTADS